MTEPKRRQNDQRRQTGGLATRRLLSNRWAVVAAGLSLMLAVLLTLAGLAWHDRTQLLERVHERNDLMARLFADRATRNVDSAALALATIGELVGRGLDNDAAELRTALSQTLVSLPFLRGVALVDAQGKVLASSEPREVGLSIEQKALGKLPELGRDQLGSFVPLRRLSDLAKQKPGSTRAATPPGVGFLPLLRTTQSPSKELVTLVAQLNLDAFINFQQVTMNDDRAASALLAYGGQLLAASSGVSGAVGGNLATLAPFTQFLPRLEQGQWVGQGLRPGVQIAAFRVAATRPLVVMVEFDEAHALAEWSERSRSLLAAAVAATLLIGAMTALASRSLAARERARAQLDLAQQQVARRERELSVTIASLQELIFRTDAGGVITFANDRWPEFTGMPVEKAAGRQLWDLVDSKSREGTRALFAPGAAAAVRKLQASIADANGGLRWLDVSVMPLREFTGNRENDRIIGFAGSAIDVTDFREAEIATREARDVAEEASRAKSEFIANISHELRTPLQSIIGFSELGLMRGREQPKLAAMFTDIHGAGQRMLGLVNDLLDVAKIESTVGTMNLERCDLRGLVRSVARELAPQLAARQLQLELQLPDYPLRAKVDPMRFEQVMRNVLANAAKFSPSAGRIVISGEQTELGELHLAVADDGPGIPPAELERIFEAFVQSSQTKDGSGGTGLGLAICQKVLEAHGGRIHAANGAAGGAVFHIHLPAHAAGETRPAPL